MYHPSWKYVSTLLGICITPTVCGSALYGSALYGSALCGSALYGSALYGSALYGSALYDSALCLRVCQLLRLCPLVVISYSSRSHRGYHPSSKSVPPQLGIRITPAPPSPRHRRAPPGAPRRPRRARAVPGRAQACCGNEIGLAALFHSRSRPGPSRGPHGRLDSGRSLSLSLSPCR